MAVLTALNIHNVELSDFQIVILNDLFEEKLKAFEIKNHQDVQELENIIKAYHPIRKAYDAFMDWASSIDDELDDDDWF